MCNKFRVGVSKGDTRESERHTEQVREQQDSRNGTTEMPQLVVISKTKQAAGDVISSSHPTGRAGGGELP